MDVVERMAARALQKGVLTVGDLREVLAHRSILDSMPVVLARESVGLFTLGGMARCGLATAPDGMDVFAVVTRAPPAGE